MGNATNVKPKSVAQRSNAQVYDQGITYNEPGLTYNQIGVAYGGVYGQSIMAITSTVPQVRPMIVRSFDFPGSASGGQSGQLMGILGLTYP